MQQKIIERYFFFGLLFATFIFTFLIFRPFWVVLVLGASFSILLHPVYVWLNKKHFPNWVAAIISLLFFIIVLCIPLFAIGTIVFNQSQSLYHNIISNGNVIPFINSASDKINQFLPTGITFDVSQKISGFISFLTSNLANIFGATATLLFSFILLLLSIFYFLKDGEKWKAFILRLSPLSNTDDEKIIERLSKTIKGVVGGIIFIALIQGILMGIGLTIFGVKNAAIWGVVTAITSLIPTVGTSLVSIPAIIYLFATGHIVSAVGLAVWASILVGAIDNFLSPYIVGGKIKIPPFLILFSVLGGISLLGPVGILIGPLTVSLLYALMEIYQGEFKQIQNN
ncbi:MAG: AI-2E family transporter [Candidatus Paceibacterota bacterium]|jgi:predicted PurR-regulated permease PerM